MPVVITEAGSGWAIDALVYPRTFYTDLDNLICKKSEEEASSEAEMG